MINALQVIKFWLLLIPFAITYNQGVCQQIEIKKYTFGNGGNVYNIDHHSNITISHTIGQSSLIGAFSAGSIHLLQGFQHQDLQYSRLTKKSKRLFSVYPNPSRGIVNLTWNDDEINGDIQVTLNNLEGKKLDHGSYRIIGNQLTIDYSSIQKGLYHIQVYSQEEDLGNAKIILY